MKETLRRLAIHINLEDMKVNALAINLIIAGTVTNHFGYKRIEPTMTERNDTVVVNVTSPLDIFRNLESTNEITVERNPTDKMNVKSYIVNCVSLEGKKDFTLRRNLIIVSNVTSHVQRMEVCEYTYEHILAKKKLVTASNVISNFIRNEILRDT